MQLVERTRRARERARCGGVVALAILLGILYLPRLSAAFQMEQQGTDTAQQATDIERPKPPKKRTKTKPVAAKQTIEQALAASESLALHLQSKLPTGMSVHDAAQGFTRLEDFVAAVEACGNLDINWVELKSLVTGPHPHSLADAIHKVNPNVSGPYEGRRALKQAAELIDSTQRPAEASVAAHR